MTKIYIYPNFALNVQLDLVSNPYILDLKSSLRKHTHVTEPLIKFAFIDFLLNSFTAKIIVLNWVESVYDTKFGKFKYVLLLCYLFLYKSFGKRIVGVVHNKFSHSGVLNEVLIKRVYAYFSVIVVHARDGEFYLKNQLNLDNVFYFPHPIKISSTPFDHMRNCQYDFLIWGRISSYKGIKEFLEWRAVNFVTSKILIVGEDPTNLLENLPGHLYENVEILPKYVSDDELVHFHRISSCVLFTHSSPSVFSSGSLIWSLGLGSWVAAPRVGAFQDYAGLPNLFIYDSFEDLFNFKRDTSSIIYNHELFKSWDQFGDFIIELL